MVWPAHERTVQNLGVGLFGLGRETAVDASEIVLWRAGHVGVESRGGGHAVWSCGGGGGGGDAVAISIVRHLLMLLMEHVRVRVLMLIRVDVLVLIRVVGTATTASVVVGRHGRRVGVAAGKR